MSEGPMLLPLGSAVSVEGEDDTFILIARGFQKSDTGFLAGYKGVRHPLGAGSGAKELVIRETQIVEVVHRGFESPEDGEFAKKALEVAKAPPARQEPVAEPDLTIDLSKPVAATTPPSASGVIEVVAPAAIANPKDPFSELRSKGKRK